MAMDVGQNEETIEQQQFLSHTWPMPPAAPRTTAFTIVSENEG